MALGTLLKIGAKGEAVLALQQALQARGFDPGPVDGDFGPGTDQAVRLFQQANGLEVDGVVGVQTASGLGIELGSERSTATLVALGFAAEERFGLRVAECSHPEAPARWGPVGGHSAKSLHYEHRAFDATGSTSSMRDFATWVADNHTPGVAELIHNPTGSVKDGRRVDAGFWGSECWAAHADHVHLAV